MIAELEDVLSIGLSIVPNLTPISSVLLHQLVGVRHQLPLVCCVNQIGDSCSGNQVI